MRLILFIFLFYPQAQAEKASNSNSKVEVKDYCPHAFEGRHDVSLSDWQRLLKSFKWKSQKKQRNQREEGSGRR